MRCDKDSSSNGAPVLEETSFIVTWDGPSDPQHPRNWSALRKWRNVVLISAQATLSPMASIVLAVAGQSIADDFGLTDVYTPSLPTALFVLGFGLGPLFLAPLSEAHGRRVVYLTTFALFTLTNVACAVAPTLAALCIFRFLSGMAGSAGPSIGGGTIGDMFDPATRGRAHSFYSFGPVGGNAVGGVVAGFVLHGLGGWRWLCGVMAIAAGVVLVLSVFLLQETFPPYLLQKRAEKARKTSGDERWAASSGDLASSARAQGTSGYSKITRNITRAARMLFTSPICAATSIYMALTYGILYLHVVTLPLLFSSQSQFGLPSYHWPDQLTGLAYLGMGIGSLLGSLLGGLFLNRTYAAMNARAQRRAARVVVSGSDTPTAAAAAEDPRRPEYRMPFMQLGALVVPAGLFIFAFTARPPGGGDGDDDAGVPWAAPLVGAGLFAAGMLMTYICVTTYLVDVFETYAASAIAAMTVTRTLLACVFAVVGNELYRSMGYRSGTLVLAGLCVVLAPLPVVFYHVGPKLRAMGRFAA